jgi:hypothetical protein
MLIRLSGIVHNSTVGTTPQAQVRSRGEHDFRMEKEVDFDGLRCLTRTPAAWVTPRIYNTSATTPLREFPIIGEPFLEPVGRMTALSGAEARRREAERIAAERVTTEAARAFNDQADGQLTTINQALAGFQRSREELGIAPAEERVRSTDDLVQYSARYDGGSLANPIPAEFRNHVVRGVSLLVNDSLLNAGADDLPIAGREFAIRDIEQFIEGLLVQIPGFVPSEPPSNPLVDEGLMQIRLDDHDPLDVAFLNDETHLTLRMSFQAADGPSVEMRLVTIVYRAEISDEWVILAPSDVRVDSSAPDGDPLAAITDDVIREQFVERLIPLQFRNGSTLALPGAPDVRITVRELTSSDGWLLLSAE